MATGRDFTPTRTRFHERLGGGIVRMRGMMDIAAPSLPHLRPT